MAGEIVVGYDGSECSKAAVRFATDVAVHYGVELCIGFCFEAPAALAGGAMDQRRQLEALGEQLLAEAEQLTAASGVKVQRELVDARPAEGLLLLADSHDAPVIVIGHGTRGPFTGALLGSVAYQLVHHATRPVVVVPEPN